MICQRCGCSELNPCINPFGETCGWILPGLCSFCLTEQEIELVRLIALQETAIQFVAQLPNYSPAQHAEAARLYQEVYR